MVVLYMNACRLKSYTGCPKSPGTVKHISYEQQEIAEKQEISYRLLVKYLNINQ